MSITPEAFIQKYTNTRLNERGGAQLHFIDLCDLLQVPRPTGGEEYRFEQPVLKVAGGKGFADVYSEGKFGWEYKGKNANLEKAYLQLLSYREDLDNPPLLIVSDMQTIELHTNFTGTQKSVIRWTLEDLKDGQRREQLRRVWLDPASFNPSQRIELATVAAVESLAKVSETLKARHEDPEMVAHFLVRVMFTLFAEDVELLPRETFKRLLEAAKKEPEDFKEMCEELFSAMSVGKKTLVGRIPHINGGVFENTSAPSLSRDEVNRLYDASRRDWKQVDPTIFGTLFETVIDPSKRWQLGAHYTPLSDILDVVEPVVMRPLRAEWEAIRSDIGPLLAEIDEAHAQRGGDLYAQAGLGQAQMEEALGKLSDFQNRLALVTVLDPAMGSGNFLYVTLRLLLDLEAEVRETIRTITQDVPPSPKVSPRQMLGMEVNQYAHEIAGMVLWIGYLQWLREHDENFRLSPVLDKLPGLMHQDAVFDATTKQIREWPQAEFIVGNPPFLGYSPMRQQLNTKDNPTYVDDLRAAYADRIPGFSDFVCYFFEKARENIENGNTKRVGLIATNSISGGENARVLDRILETGEILRAWPDRAWIQDGAAVRTSVVIFGKKASEQKVLLHHEGDERNPAKRITVERFVEHINADLTSGPNLRSAKGLQENFGRSFIGVFPGVIDFVIPERRAGDWVRLPNPEGVNNSDVLKPFKGGEDINDIDAMRYIIDFSDYDLDSAKKYDEPMQWVVNNVKPKKDQSAEKANRERWWQFKRTNPAMRAAIKPLSRYIATSRHSKFRNFVWLPKNVVPDSALAIVAADDDYTFGVLNSVIHDRWATRLGTAVGKGNDPRYTPTTTFETFPFPRPTPEQRSNIAKAAIYLEEVRAFLKTQEDPKKKVFEGKLKADQLVTFKPLTLTGMYNLLQDYRISGIELVSGIAALHRAHAALDAAVAEAYGWAWPMVEDEFLAHLLDINMERYNSEEGKK